MTLKPVVFEQFRGLNLADDPEQIGAEQALDMLNIEVPHVPGRLRTRGGLVRLGTGTATYHRTAGAIMGASNQVLGFRNSGAALVVDSSDLSGVVSSAVGSWGNASTRATSTVQVNVLGTNVLAVASRSGASNEGLHLGDGSTVGVSGSPRYIGVWSLDDRAFEAHFTAAAGGPTGANGTRSTIFFSDPSAYMTWGANNWTALALGDGDEITGVATWRDLLFVIKRKTLFVFYSTTVTPTGAPDFNYHTISLPSQARVTTNGGGENIVAANDGVYLYLADGIYRTTGQTPLKVSRDIEPLLVGTGPSNMVLPNSGDWNFSYADNRIFLTYTVAGTFRTLVYDTSMDAWFLWDLSVGSGAQPTNVTSFFDTNGTPTVYILAGSKFYSMTYTNTTDDGTSINWFWQSGWFDLGFPGVRKRIRLCKITGTGTPTFSIFTDFGSSDPLAATLTLGVSPIILEADHTIAYRGKQLSYKLSGSSATIINRVEMDLADVSVN